MATISLSKSSLQQQRDKLGLFERFLPALDLKRQQLTAESKRTMQVLAEAEQGKLDFGALPSAAFFAALLDATMEGFFSDPIYGGNRDKIGWKLVGFPGVHASYANDIERHGVAWARPPASIADAAEGR